MFYIWNIQELDKKVLIFEKDEEDEKSNIDWLILRKDDILMIYMCVIMWYELENEMIQILKLIFR